jgi:quercetin dioxygenase-like cupin family protein
MEFIKKEDIKILSNPDCDSHQLLFPENSLSERVTITKVQVKPKGCQRRHKHDSSEQIWIANKGKGLLLLADNEEMEFKEGDVVRFADGDIHGILNSTDEIFEYISVTSPPINFRYAYKNEK